MPHPQAKVHRMFELVEPIATVTFSEVPNEAFLALGMRNYWDGYFAGRAAPLGLAPAEVVHAVFYNFADGEVARHIPWVWGKTTPAGGDRRARAGQRRRAAADDRGARRLPRSGAGRRPRHPGGGQRADRGPSAVRRAPGARRARGAGGQALARGDAAAGAPRGRPQRRPASPTASAAPRPTS